MGRCAMQGSPACLPAVHTTWGAKKGRWDRCAWRQTAGPSFLGAPQPQPQSLSFLLLPPHSLAYSSLPPIPTTAGRSSSQGCHTVGPSPTTGRIVLCLKLFLQRPLETLCFSSFLDKVTE